MLGIQKAGLLKRFSAFLLDFILLTIVVTGLAFLLFQVTGYDNHLAFVENKEAEYEAKYSVEFDVLFNDEEFNKLSEAEQKSLTDYYVKFASDPEVAGAYNLMFNLTLMITSLSIFLAVFILEFIIPLFLKDGMTVGKKIFGIGVIQENGVRMKNVTFFTRAILGKYTIEMMIPVIIITMMLLGSGGLIGVIVLGLILLFEAFVFFKDKNYTLIHDVLAHTVCVDMQTQLIFDTEEELLAYKERIHAEMAERSPY